MTPSRPILVALALAALLCGCKSSTGPAPSTPISENLPTITRTPYAEREQPRQRRSRPHNTGTSAQPGDFDFYLLNLSWSPEFCATHSSSPECAAHLGFVVHGLWPQNDDGTYPEDCSNAPGPSNPQSDTDLQPTVSLVEHEWQTHGTCSGLAADAYFSTIRQAYHAVVIPPNFQHVAAQQIMSPDAILAQFAQANPTFPAGAFALSCGNNYLTAIEVCMSKSLQPEACQAVRSCRANVVKVTAP